MTGWFNIVGLIGIVASVGYGAAIFLNTTARPLRRSNIFGINFGDTAHILSRDVPALLHHPASSTRW